MKKLQTISTVLAVAGVVVFGLLCIGCDDAGAGDDDSPSSGTVSVSVSNADDTHTLFAFLYAAGEKSIYNDEKMLACNYIDVSGGTASVVLKTTDGNATPTASNWVGTAGSTYDLYVYCDCNADGDDEPATTGAGTQARRMSAYPYQVTIDGNQAITTSFDQMVAYTGGTCTIQVTDSGSTLGVSDIMFFGIFRHGADPSVDDAVAYCDDAPFGATTAFETDAITAKAESTPTWYGVDGTMYDVYVFIDLGGTNNGSDDGPQAGDYYYSVQYTQDGNETITPSYNNTDGGDFEVFPGL